MYMTIMSTKRRHAACTHRQSQIGFIELIGNNFSFTSIGEQRYNSISNDILTEASWQIKINPIQNFLEGNELSVFLPEISEELIFKAHRVESNEYGDYNWLGYSENSDRSMKIAKFNSGYTGYIDLSVKQCWGI